MAAKCQIHSPRHNATCFKYGVPGTKNCRFNFPRPLVETTTINNLGTIDIQKNHVWVNPFNSTLMSITRSNHDVNCISSNVKALALVEYITNYATKGDCSQYQRVMGAAFVQKSWEKKAKAMMRGNQAPPGSNLDHKFCLKAYNQLAYDKKISGPFVASTLLGLPKFYTLDWQVQKLSLYALRYRLSKMLHSSSKDETDNSKVRESPGDIDEEDQNGVDPLVPFQITTRHSSSMLDSYCWRGAQLEQLSLYEYFRLATIIETKNRQAKDIDFDPAHLDYTKKSQRLATSISTVKLMALTGALSTNESAENAVSKGHSSTDARENNLAQILLGLFVLWEVLQVKCANFGDKDLPTLYLYRDIWLKMKIDLPEHLIFYADNICQMQRSNIEQQTDKQQRQ